MIPKNKLYLCFSLYEDCFLRMFNRLIIPAMKTNKRLLKLTDILFPLLMLCLGTRMILNWTGGEQGTIDTLRVFLYGLTEIALIVVLLTYGIYLCVQQWRKYQQSQSKWRMASLFFILVIVLACLDLGYWTFFASHPDILAFWEQLQSWF